MTSCATDPNFPEALDLFDAHGVAKRLGHAVIFDAHTALQPGATLRFCLSLR